MVKGLNEMNYKWKRLGLKEFRPRGPEAWGQKEGTDGNMRFFSFLYVPPLGMLAPSQHSYLF